MRRAFVTIHVLIVMSVCLNASSGLTGEKPVYDPFKIPKEKLRAEIKKVVLSPIQLPADLEDSDWEERLVMQYAANRLEDLGFEIVKDREFQVRWLKYSEKLGGVFDSKTGIPDADKFGLALEYTMRELADRHNVDAVVLLAVFRRVTEVQWGGRVLRSAGSSLVWDGKWIPSHKKFRLWPQRVESAMLGIEILNGAGTIVFSVGCPIGWAKIYMDRGFEERPNEEVYTSDHIRDAVDVCLGNFKDR